VIHLLRSVAAHPTIAPLLRSRVFDAGDLSPDRVATRSVVFESADAKARWLDAMATLDPNDPRALRISLARFCRDGIKYVRDPAGEEFSDAEQTLRQGFGDCDDKARCYVALCRSLQIPARIRPCAGVDISDPNDFVHVQAEVKNESGSWDVVELIVRGVNYGELPKKGKQVLQ
jgi:transglutaminase-like putative cysteine protease